MFVALVILPYQVRISRELKKSAIKNISICPGTLASSIEGIQET